jgi:hypothetical protein
VRKAISKSEVARMVGIRRCNVDAFLRAHGITERYKPYTSRHERVFADQVEKAIQESSYHKRQ